MTLGRPKKFNEAEVLGKAMNLFWLHGYQGIGLSGLCSGMGISRQSLYDTFGDKRTLFIKAIHFYRENLLSQLLQILADPANPLENVRKVMGYFECRVAANDFRGCLVANTLVELGQHDKEIADLLGDTLGLLEQGLRTALQNAQKAGELPPDRDTKLLARTLTNAFLGMAVSSRLSTHRESIKDVFQGVMATLK